MQIIDYRYGTTLLPLFKRHFSGMLKGATFKKSVNTLYFLFERYLKRLESKSKPFYIKIEPTNFCDQSCTGCATSSPRSKGFMDLSLYKRIIDFVKPYCLRNCLYGQGESFLHKNIFEMINYSELNNCPVSICTNFQSFSQEKSKQLLASGINRIIICVDGLSQEMHSKFRKGGNLDKVLQNLQDLALLKAKGNYKFPIIEVQTIAFPYNINDLSNISNLVKDLGTEVHVIRENMFNLLEKKLKKSTCPYLWGSIFFTWDGRMCPCEEGNIDTNHIILGFEEMEKGVDYWNNSKMVYARSLIKYGKDKNCNTGLRCEKCPFYPL
jgi:MoaA/NifB/PqqE/SkfB family radical SAM enzyme